MTTTTTTKSKSKNKMQSEATTTSGCRVSVVESGALEMLSVIHREEKRGKRKAKGNSRAGTNLPRPEVASIAPFKLVASKLKWLERKFSKRESKQLNIRPLIALLLPLLVLLQVIGSVAAVSSADQSLKQRPPSQSGHLDKVNFALGDERRRRRRSIDASHSNNKAAPPTISCNDYHNDDNDNDDDDYQLDNEQAPEVARNQLDIYNTLKQHFDLSASNHSSSSSNDSNVQSAIVAPKLPRPSNLTVLIMSWYPPVLKLSWNLDVLSELTEAQKFDFYRGHSALAQSERLNVTSRNVSEGSMKKESLAGSQQKHHQGSSQQQQQSKFESDLDLALESVHEARQSLGEDESGQTQVAPFVSQLKLLKERQLLAKKALTCFQVTYNIVNSRFKVIEEFPPYLRSVLLERLLPATEYNLRVSAIYLNGHFRLTSDRVRFISPTDNESRRFKENTYRPIHRYPDEEPPLEGQNGLAQVRSEELTLVGIALFFWFATICLFFNKWGKIRMLEPYQPAYREQTTGSGVVVGAAGLAVGVASPSPPTSGSIVATHQLSSMSAQNLLAAAAANGRQSSTATGTTAGTTTCATSGPHQALDDGQGGIASLPAVASEALMCRKSSMMLLCNQRFNPTTGVPTAAPTPVQPTTAATSLLRRPTATAGELPVLRTSGALFHSKASALVKASRMWPAMGAQSANNPLVGPLPVPLPATNQKLKQESYHKAKLMATGMTTTAADFETLRRVGRCLAARRRFMRLTGHASYSLGAAAAAARRSQYATSAGSGADGEANDGGGGDPLERLAKATASARLSSVGSGDHFGVRHLTSGGAGETPHSQQHPVSRTVESDPKPEATQPPRYNPGLWKSGDTTTVAPASRPLVRFIRRNPAVDYTNSSPRDSMRTATQSLDHPSKEEEEDRKQRIDTSELTRRREQFINRLQQTTQLQQSASTCTLQLQRRQRQQQAVHSARNSTSLDRYPPEVRPTSKASVPFVEKPKFLISGVQLVDERGDKADSERAANSDVEEQNDELKLLSLSSLQERTHILIEPPSPPTNKKTAATTTTTETKTSLDETRGPHLAGEANRSFAVAEETAEMIISGGGGDDDVDQQQQQKLETSGAPPGVRESSCCSCCSPDLSCVSDQVQINLDQTVAHQQPRNKSESICGGEANAWRQLAETARASTERRLSRTYCARSLATLAGTSGCCCCHHSQQSEVGHYAHRASLCVSQQQQQQTNRCLRCDSRSAALHQLRALQHRLEHQEERDELILPSCHHELSAATSSRHRRPRISSVFAGQSAGAAAQHRDSFAMLRALSGKKYKSAEDIAYLSSLVLQIWTRREPPANPLLTSVSQLQINELASTSGSQHRRSGSASDQQQQQQLQKQSRSLKPKSSLTVANL